MLRVASRHHGACFKLWCIHLATTSPPPCALLLETGRHMTSRNQTPRHHVRGEEALETLCPHVCHWLAGGGSRHSSVTLDRPCRTVQHRVPLDYAPGTVVLGSKIASWKRCRSPSALPLADPADQRERSTECKLGVQERQTHTNNNLHMSCKKDQPSCELSIFRGRVHVRRASGTATPQMTCIIVCRHGAF